MEIAYVLRVCMTDTLKAYMIIKMTRKLLIFLNARSAYEKTIKEKKKFKKEKKKKLNIYIYIYIYIF